MIASLGSEMVKLATLEFNNSMACISVILWQLIPLTDRTQIGRGRLWKKNKGRDMQAWNRAITELTNMITVRLPEFGFDACKVDTKFDRNYFTPYRDGESIEFRHRANPEHGDEERNNLIRFGTFVEDLGRNNMLRLYRQFQQK